MTDTPTTKVTVFLPWYSPTNSAEARAQYLASLRHQGRVQPELEDAILNDKPITSARRQTIEEERWRALQDQDWVLRHRKGDQEAKSQYVNWTGWLGRRVEG
jgi:hypothetical protein